MLSGLSGVQLGIMRGRHLGAWGVAADGQDQEVTADSVCPAGHPNSAGARFCRTCGAALPGNVGSLHPTETVATSEAGAVGAVAAEPPGKIPPPAQVPAPAFGGAQASWQPARPTTRKVWPIAVIVVLALLVAGMGAAFAVVGLSHKTPSVTNSPPPTPHLKTTDTPAPSPTATVAPTTSTTAAAELQATTLSSLLQNSAQDRSQIVAAVNQITSCGDLASAQETLDQAASSRQNLLSQLGQLQLGALPNSSQLTQSLQAAWQASLDADNSYAAYAGDEMSNFNGCTPNDPNDQNAQAAASSDAQATTAKTEFTSLWNPIAQTYNLPQWQPTQL
jgi:hypothetical protein